MTPARVLLVLAAVTLGLGLTGPCMTITPHFGAYDGWVRLLTDAQFTDPKRFSILSGIRALFDQRQAGIAALLLLFSVCFPAAKLCVMGYAEAAGRGGPALTLAHHAGKFSMLDVFVVGVLVVVLKGIPGETQVALGWGLYAFAASVLLSLIAGFLLERRTAGHRPSVASGPGPAV